MKRITLTLLLAAAMIAPATAQTLGWIRQDILTTVNSDPQLIVIDDSQLDNGTSLITVSNVKHRSYMWTTYIIADNTNKCVVVMLTFLDPVWYDEFLSGYRRERSNDFRPCATKANCWTFTSNSGASLRIFGRLDKDNNNIHGYIYTVYRNSEYDIISD